jgi:SAM-dependent methyltransferase
VLDIGSGDKPHWRSDVLLDKYISDEYGDQRSGDKKTVISRPIFDADAESMPFGDKVFDYVICSHLLEHVIHPGKVIDEIMRVGKAGYIEVPYEGKQKISDFPTHLWYCRIKENTLVFTAKNSVYFDKEIDNYVKHVKILASFEDEIVSLYWNDAIDYCVVGEANQEILEEEITVKYDPKIYLIRNMLNMFFSIIFFFKKRRTPIMINTILKPSLRPENDLPLKKRVYKY